MVPAEENPSTKNNLTQNLGNKDEEDKKDPKLEQPTPPVKNNPDDTNPSSINTPIPDSSELELDQIENLESRPPAKTDLTIIPELEMTTGMQYMYARDLALRSEILNSSSDLDLIIDNSGVDNLLAKLNEDNEKISKISKINNIEEYKKDFNIPEEANSRKTNRLFEHEKKVFENTQQWEKQGDDTLKSGSLEIKVSDASKLENKTKKVSFVSNAMSPEEFKRDAFNMVRLAVSTKTKFKAVIRSTDPERILELYHQFSAAGIKPELSQDSLEVLNQNADQKSIIDTIASYPPGAYRAYVQTMDIANELDKVSPDTLDDTLQKEGIKLPKGVGMEQLKGAMNIIKKREQQTTINEEIAPPSKNNNPPTPPVSQGATEKSKEDANFARKPKA